ncbi:hypothetical protein K503DRAFT_767272 [Rhizopogon vinicolor AM-OR11-026]|uniref:F-box domain-containing protein n=1 Tax=Rhizopogon vinicolor AM-OR11-026 TaxID=1314800 RepID=A0A1B7NAG4_9AGAM|nr:hypothetical protein K503DRAFT_767272 [Rhizopogon vinicolor AM-OR11-026]
MHVCLFPTEILLDIFTTILKNPRSCATIAALARTCRTFKEPALDVLWHHVNGFKPLLSCLPEGVLKRTREGKLSLERPLIAKEWTVLSQYAHRIHSLTISSSELDQINDRVVQALIHMPSSALLPKLQSLQWLDDRESFFPLLCTLLLPTIRELTLRCGRLGPWAPSFATSALLGSLAARCPFVRLFNCGYKGDLEDSDAVCEAACNWRELAHLTTGVLDTQALAHLASLPSLKFLDFRSFNFVDDARLHAIPTFNGIEEVSISAPSHSLLIRCLKNVSFLCCRSAELRIDGSNSEVPLLPYDPMIPDLIVSISECFSSTLEQLNVNTDFDSSTLHEDALTAARFAFGFHAIAPLLPFSRLTQLSLNWLCTSYVDDDALKNMVQSWPRLEVFYFGTATRWLVPPSLTFIGLAHLIQHCRHLYRIAIPFRAFGIDTNSKPFSATIPNKNVTSLFVGLSPIDDAEAVACQLHALMPNLTDVGHWSWQDLGQPRQSVVAYDNGWNRVDDYLQVLTKSAKMREELKGSQKSPLPARRL